MFISSKKIVWNIHQDDGNIVKTKPNFHFEMNERVFPPRWNFWRNEMKWNETRQMETVLVEENLPVGRYTDTMSLVNHKLYVNF